MEEDPNRPKKSEGSKTVEVSFAGKKVDFNMPWHELVIELGTSIGGLIVDPNAVEYLTKNQRLYLGVERNLGEVATLAIATKRYPWAASLGADYFDAEKYPSPEIANELWMQNFLAVNEDTVDRGAKIAFETLKPGGKVVFVDNRSSYLPDQRDAIIKGFVDAGFTVNQIDLANDQHPMVASTRKKGFRATIVAFTATKLGGTQESK